MSSHVQSRICGNRSPTEIDLEHVIRRTEWKVDVRRGRERARGYIEEVFSWGACRARTLIRRQLGLVQNPGSKIIVDRAMHRDMKSTKGSWLTTVCDPSAYACGLVEEGTSIGTSSGREAEG